MPSRILIAWRKCWPFGHDPSGLTQAATYIVPLAWSITGVLRMPQWSLMLCESIFWLPWIGVPSFRVHSSLPSVASKAKTPLAIVAT